MGPGDDANDDLGKDRGVRGLNRRRQGEGKTRTGSCRTRRGSAPSGMPAWFSADSRSSRNSDRSRRPVAPYGTQGAVSSAEPSGATRKNSSSWPTSAWYPAASRLPSTSARRPRAQAGEAVPSCSNRLPGAQARPPGRTRSPAISILRRMSPTVVMVSVNAIPPSMVKTCQTGAAPIPDWWKAPSRANGTLLASVMPEAFTTVPITVRTPASWSSRCALATADSSADAN